MKNSTTSLTLSFVMVAGGNILFHLLSGRLLGPAGYGSLGAMLTLLLALGVPAGAVQVALTAEVSRLHEADRYIASLPLLLRFLAAGSICAGAIAASAPILAGWLGIESALQGSMLALFFIPAFGGIVGRSILLGRRQYRRLGTILVIATAARVAVGGALLLLVPSVTMALAVIVASEFLALAMLVWGSGNPVRDALENGAIPWDLRISTSQLLGAVAAFAGFWLLVGLDVIVGKRFLTSEAAGVYAATALAARAVLFIPQSITSSALPDLSRPGEHGRSALRRTLALSSATAAFCAVVVSTAGPTVLSVLLGGDYAFSPGTLVILCIAAIAAGATNVLVSFHLAQGSIVRSNGAWIGIGFMLIVSPVITGSIMLALVSLTALSISFGIAMAGLTRRTSVEARPPRTAPSCQVSVVMPMFNEGDSGSRAVQATVAALRGMEFEVIVVDDGSTDGVWKEQDHSISDRVTVICLASNQGKGAALRTGMAAAGGELVALLDGDGDIDPRHLVPMIEAIEHYGADGVLGSKAHPASHVVRSMRRNVLSAASSRVIATLFDVRVADTQVGVKVYRRSVVDEVLGATRENGFLFDVEFIALASARGHRHLIEYPVAIEGLSTSSVTGPATVRTFAGLIRLAWRWHSVSARERGEHESPTLQLA